MAYKVSIETVAHESIVVGEFATREEATAKVQEMITVFQEIDAQVGDDMLWETWLDVPEDLKARERCIFESDLPILEDTETGETWWWSDDTDSFIEPHLF